MSPRLRVLMIASHPVQYAASFFRFFAKDPRLEIQVAYCSMRGAEPHIDPGFGVEVKWDIPLLDGYPWIDMSNGSLLGRFGSFFSLANPQAWKLVRSRQFDAVILYTGYVYATFWIAILAAKCSRVPVLFGTDAHDLAPRDHKAWKLWIKRLLWPRLFRLADVAMVSSSASVDMMRALGISANRVVLTPYSVNNEWWIERSSRIDSNSVRARWGIPQDAVVVLFSAKLQPWKRPLDLLRAFARVPVPNVYLIFAGDGSLRSSLETEAEVLGVAARVRFFGFVNQSGLPEIYTASDILVLPSEYEPFGVVVNEAMLCGCCVVVSDRVGARFDLVREGETGFVFRAGDVEALARLLGKIAADQVTLKRIGRAARERMADWSQDKSANATLRAVEKAVRLRSSETAGVHENPSL
jgi:glycosyltransferase involved in cell wall biosynthesis